MTLTLAVTNETRGRERRVALVPDAIRKLLKNGSVGGVFVEADAGKAAGYPDGAYKQAGAEIWNGKGALAVDICLRVTPPGAKDKLPIKPEGVLVTLTAGADSWPGLFKAAKNVLALEKLPRTSRAQAMDVLSSQANLGGYAAVLSVAQYLPRLMPQLMTAAGSSKPANILVLGVGVAGLQAIATARRLGAVVHAFDVRPEVSEQIKSLGAKVVELGEQGSAISDQAKKGQGGYAGAMDEAGMRELQRLLLPFISVVDGVVSTAQVPGRPAPVLVSAEAVETMKPGSVVVDLAAGGFNKANGIAGGNCPLTVADDVVVTDNGVTLIGETNWASTVAGDASRFWAQNMVNLLGILVKDGKISFEDELVKAMRIGDSN